MRVAIAVQRYGEDVAGGAELHARYVAERLALAHQVTVLTTTARDYLSWANHYPPGESAVGPVRVRRFPVERERDQLRFAAAARRAYAPGHSRQDELDYLAEQGPWAPGLWRHLEGDGRAYDALVAFSYRYLTSREAVLRMPGRTLLVPTAEADPAIGLETSREVFRAAAQMAYNTPEERALIERAVGPPPPAGEVVGIGSRIPAAPDAGRFRRLQAVTGPYVLYVGRIDRNKGCAELFEQWAAFVAETGFPHRLLLVGQAVLPIPDHPRIRHLGFLGDDEKFDALAGADLLIVPSEYESLSMVALEAMALGVPVLANGRCDVLRGQMQRSNGGLYYHGYDQLFEALRLLLETPRLRAILGRQGQAYYQANYRDEVVGAKLERLLARAAGPGA